MPKTTLEEYEKKLLEGYTAHAEAVSLTRDILLDITRCKRTMEDLKHQVKKFKEKVKIGKTVGTATNVFGSACTIGIHIYISISCCAGIKLVLISYLL